MPSSSTPSDPGERRPADPGEQRLVEGLIAGRHDSITEFLERTHHPVYCMACRFTFDAERRRDWAHTVLLAILDDLERGRFIYRGGGSFWAWFRKRAYFRLLDEFRRSRQTAARESTTDASGEPRDLDASAGGEDPADIAEREELRAALEACLERIANRDQRRAVALLVLDDLSYQDIAAAMSAPLNTVRAWIRRGRSALRRCLAERLGLAAPGGES